MNDSQVIEKALVSIASQFEKFSQNFVVAFETHATAQRESKWYSPKQLVLRLIRTAAVASPPEVQVLAVAVHGALDVLGFAGTLRLVINLKRRRDASKQPRRQEKDVQRPLSGEGVRKPSTDNG